jgi:predicted acetyltransferase
MNIEMHRATVDDKSVLRNLLELCQHDYSEYDGMDVNEHGLFGYNYLDNYWTEEGRHPFLIKVSSKLAGFVLVRTIHEPGNTPIHTIAEFFVMRKYRRQGVGRYAAQQVFDMFSGSWSVAQEEENVPAQAFWRKVISEYTDGRYKEDQSTGWDGPIQKFESHIVG